MKSAWHLELSTNESYYYYQYHPHYLYGTIEISSAQNEKIKQMRGEFAKNGEARRGSRASPELIPDDFSDLGIGHL